MEDNYLADLIKEKKQLELFPNFFPQMSRLVDDEIARLRGAVAPMSHLTAAGSTTGSANDVSRSVRASSSVFEAPPPFAVKQESPSFRPPSCRPPSILKGEFVAVKQEPIAFDEFETPLKPTVTWGLSALAMEPLPTHAGAPGGRPKERSKSTRSAMSRAEEQMVEQMCTGFEAPPKSNFSMSFIQIGTPKENTKRLHRSSAAIHTPHPHAEKQTKQATTQPKSGNVARKVRKWVKRTATKVWPANLELSKKDRCGSAANKSGNIITFDSDSSAFSVAQSPEQLIEMPKPSRGKKTSSKHK